MSDAVDSIEALVRLHEGRRLRCYDDATGAELRPGDTLRGHPTIGIGRALDRRGIDDEEADWLFARDILEARRAVVAAIPWSAGLDVVRRAVLVDMSFNLGIRGLVGFRRMLAALELRDYETAAAEMLFSKWATQVGPRARRLATMMEHGQWPT